VERLTHFKFKLINALQKFLDTDPVHLAADTVVVGQVFDGADSGDDGTLVVDVLVANRLHQVGVDSLKVVIEGG